MTLQIVPGSFAVCRLTDLSNIRMQDDFWFLARTDEEISLVCRKESVPEGCHIIEPDWRMLRVAGPLDFSLTGILARLSGILAKEEIPLFAVSTYDTDYILVKALCFHRAIDAFRAAGLDIPG